jgi:DNA repair protein RadC
MKQIKQNVSIKSLPKLDRPREKLLRYGPNKLSTEELLAIILRSGQKGQNVLTIAKNVLKKFSEKELPYITVNELKNFPGIGEVKACEIVACFELGKRLLKDKKTNLYLTPKDVFDRLVEYRDKKKEHFFVFYLDVRNQEINYDIVSVGLLNASLVHPREVFENAIKHSAAQIIVAHNHPSGDVDPSEDDLEITKRLVEAGKILGIEIIDHIIVSKDSFFSFKNKGLI